MFQERLFKCMVDSPCESFKVVHVWKEPRNWVSTMSLEDWEKLGIYKPSDPVVIQLFQLLANQGRNQWCHAQNFLVCNNCEETSNVLQQLN